MSVKLYRGRLAPSPTGLLHAGHARTFWTAQQRAREHNGVLVLRNEDLDKARCKPKFVDAMFEDLKWCGFNWQEGPDCGGSFAPYAQSERLPFYREAFEKLKRAGLVYPCTCSRQDVLRALSAPHAGEDEPIYPGTCRPAPDALQAQNSKPKIQSERAPAPGLIRVAPGSLPVNWRFQVPDGEVVSFMDRHYGRQEFVAGKDFGDFVIWRQLLLYRALGLTCPDFYHCPLVTDAAGVRLAKRHDALSLRALRERGITAEKLRESAFNLEEHFKALR